MLKEHISKTKPKMISKPFKDVNSNHYLAEFECPFCGDTFIRRTDTKAKSCGCVSNKLRGINNPKRHGLLKTHIYNAWSNMMGRCYRLSATGFKNYGGRGIKVCQEWHSFMNFYHDMNSTYQKGLTLDRIDVNGDYCPQNCRWADRETQNYNKTNNVKIEHKGKLYNSKEIEKEFGLNHRTVLARIRRSKWSVKDALTTPVQTGWKISMGV